MKRQRGRGRRSGGGNHNPNKHFESNGPDVKIRGSAQQILDKYLQYARDAQTSGDRVNAENYLQHAEHYYRVIAAMQPKDKPRDQQQDQKSGEQKAGEEGESSSADAERTNEDGSESGKNQRDGPDRGDRGRRRQRSNKPRDQETRGDAQSDVEAKVADAPDSNDAAPDAPETVAEEAPAPKPRRRAARKPKVTEIEGEEPTDGIMKTLSRGRKPKAESVTGDAAAAVPDSAE